LIPPVLGLVPAARVQANIWLEQNNLSIGARDQKDEAHLYDAFASGRARSLYIPITNKIDETLMSRFLAKVAIEILAQRLMPIEGWEEPLIDDSQLDPLRRFARIGDKPASWPFSRRRMYGEDDMQMDFNGPHQVLHEFTLLYTPKPELYAILCLFGEEFAINYGGPEIEGYTRWIQENDQRSPLYLKDRLPAPFDLLG
jgi:hypothetical protein